MSAVNLFAVSYTVVNYTIAVNDNPWRHLFKDPLVRS